MGGVLVALVESVLSSIEKICGSLVEMLGFNHALISVYTPTYDAIGQRPGDF